MTVMNVVDGNRSESLTEATARRLRGELAEQQITNQWLSDQLGVSHTWLTRRTRGRVALSTEDMERIEHVTGISPAYLVTGVRGTYGGGEPGGARPVAGNGRTMARSLKRGSLDYLSAGSALATITRLYPAPEPLQAAS